MSRLSPAAALFAAALCGPTLAQEADRPAEADLFGGPGEATPAAAPPAPRVAPDAPTRPGEPGEGGDARALDLLSGPAAEDKFKSGEAVEDPLQIGGQFYLRYFANPADDQAFKDVRFSSPTLLDVYMDARPSERIRGYARFRVSYDPTLDPNAGSSLSGLSVLGATQSSQTGSGNSTDLSSGSAPTTFGTARTTANPNFLLDQLWLKFDVGQTLFITAGRQHVRWTVARFWQPGDFLSPAQRDPLAIFDQRLGANLLKVHLPIEKLGWNFYAVGLLDNFGPGNALGKLGGGLRGEFVLGNTEVGASAVFQAGRTPRYAVDVSSELGPLDVYAEAALRPSADRRTVRFVEGAESRAFKFDLATALNGLQPLPYETYRETGPVLQATGGLSWSWAYRENDTLALGAEYFYNQMGYDDPNLFAASLLTGTYVPFYAGRHYAGAFLVFLGPGSLDNGTLTFSTLGNLSDRSFLSRVDFIYRALSFLQLESFVAYHYGNLGEFHFGLDLPAQPNLPQPLPGFTPDQARAWGSIRTNGLRSGAPLIDVGVGARISL